MENNEKSENINEVECWCCANFVLREKTLTGACTLKWKIVNAHENVCEDFVWFEGLSRTRSVPDYCKHYK